MREHAVVTLAIGEHAEQVLNLTRPSIKAYADKIDADFVVIDKLKVSHTYANYEKFQIYDLLLTYKRIIFLDCDLIIRPDCPNLFDIVPEHKFGIFNEGAYIDLLNVVRDACKKFKISVAKWKNESYNSGVMVISRLHRNIFKKPAQEFDMYEDGNKGVFHFEQPYLNLAIINSGCEVHEIGYKFNRISAMNEILGENRLASYIDHFAGYRGERRLELIKEDLKAWSESKDFKYKRNIKINVAGGLGDQICAEPVVRYIVENIYKGENIRVDTHFPYIFKHIKDIKIHKYGDYDQDETVYFQMSTMPSPETDTWRVVSYAMCHHTDFSSIAALHRILPDDKKTIMQVVDTADIESINKILGGQDAKELVLVHPGRTWESRTFPQEYWQSVIDGLVKQGLKVAVIGKYISKDQGIVPIECPKECIDLRNLLTYGELVALIWQAKVLVSNDSAPIHIAGAFDNWIVVIPSSSHPDHILPYRNGSKKYKTKALYKKLTCDAIDTSPTNIEGQTIDYVVGDIWEYLEDASVIVDTVRNVFNE